MPLPGWLFILRARLLGPSRTFSESLKPHASSQFHEDGGQVRRPHGIEHVPLALGNRDHHAVISHRNLVRDIVERDLFIHGLLAMNAAQCGQHYRQSIVGNQGQTKAEQRRLRIAQRIDFRMEVGLQVVTSSFQCPAFSVEFGHPLGRHLLREVRQDLQQRRPVSGRFIQLDA